MKIAQNGLKPSEKMIEKIQTEWIKIIFYTSPLKVAWWKKIKNKKL